MSWLERSRVALVPAQEPDLAEVVAGVQRVQGALGTIRTALDDDGLALRDDVKTDPIALFADDRRARGNVRIRICVAVSATTSRGAWGKTRSMSFSSSM